MAYEPTTWKAGDTVTSAKLNKLEQGVAANGAWIIEVSQQEVNNNDTLILGDGNITYKMIEDALEDGKIIYIKILQSDDSRFNGATDQGYAYGPASFFLKTILFFDEIVGYEVRIEFNGGGIDFAAPTKTEPLSYDWEPTLPEVVENVYEI